MQAFINMGVNLGALPTKGLTLPLMSYGGSAILLNMVALAMVFISLPFVVRSVEKDAQEHMRDYLLFSALERYLQSNKIDPGFTLKKP